MPFADPVLDAGQPCLEICEDEMDDGQKPYSQTNTTPGGCMRQPDKHGTKIERPRKLGNIFLFRGMGVRRFSMQKQREGTLFEGEGASRVGPTARNPG